MPRSSIVLVLSALVLCASVAQSQVPNLRRARDAAARVTGQPGDSTCPPPKFDNTMFELNAQVVARLIKGLEIRGAAHGLGGQTAAQLRQRAAAAYDEAAALYEQHHDDRNTWMDANRTAYDCVTEQLDNMREQHAQEMQQRFMGMAGVNTAEKTKFMQDYMAASQEAQQASMANDTAALRRAQEKLNKMMGVDARADSAKARAACNVLPVPAWMRRADSLSALANTLFAEAREAEETAAAAAARAAEMTPEQFAMTAERAEMFVRVQRTPGRVGSTRLCPWTPTEQQALAARHAELRKHFG